jgi:hypothetical protein
LCDDYDDADYTGERPDLYDYEVTISLNFARAVFAALAMPATVDRASWEADGDVRHIVDAVWAEYADCVKDRWTFRKEHIEKAIKRAIAIRNLTPPEDAP